MPSPNDCATMQAWFEGVDNARAEAAREWGAGRLEVLASDDLRARFKRQLCNWSLAYQAAWAADALTAAMLADVEKQAKATQRAWTALIAHATEAGHRPISPYVWETTLASGEVLAVVQTDAEVAKVIADGRHVACYTLKEVAAVIDALPEALRIAKVVFPGAQILPQSDQGPWKREGDAIPFGGA